MKRSWLAIGAALGAGLSPSFSTPEVGDTIAFGSNRMRLELLEPTTS